MTKITDINIKDLIPSPDNPFNVKLDEEMEKLIESISEYGVITPIIVKPAENGKHEIVSGHRRTFACKHLRLNTIPAQIRELDKNQAAVLLVDSNLHRENILPSEKAFAYKLKMDAIKRQGKRNDLTSRQVGEKLPSEEERWNIAIDRCQNGTHSTDEKCQSGTFSRSDEEIAQSTGDSARQVQRYIRLTNLIPKLLQLVDDKRIALTPAVELSYLSKDEQLDLYETIQSEDCTPSLSQAQIMRKLSNEGNLNIDKIFETMSQRKANQKEYIKLPAERFDKYFNNLSTVKDKQAFIEKALIHYTKYLEKNKERDSR